MIRPLALVMALFAMPVAAQQATNADGGEIRILDKTTGVVSDLALLAGETKRLGLLEITMEECRFPSGNPSGDAYVLLTIFYRGLPDPAFRGWMIASAPAINAMDHPRYDVWALRCKTS